MRKRNYIEEIKEIRSRSYSTRHEYGSRLYEIRTFTEHFSSTMDSYKRNELFKYVAISTVACMESFFRSASQDLIDFDSSPFKKNIHKFNQQPSVKIDFDILSAIETKEITIGNFISHILSFNNYEDINRNFSILLGVDFTEELKKFQLVGTVDYVPEENIIFKTHFSDIMESVHETFRLRHIFCHEFATKVELSELETLKHFNNCEIFLNHTDQYFAFLQNPKTLSTNFEILQNAQETLKNYEQELDSLINIILESGRKISEDLPEGVVADNFTESISKWREYREFYSKSFKDGLIGVWELIFSTERKITATILKIDILKRDFSFLLNK